MDPIDKAKTWLSTKPHLSSHIDKDGLMVKPEEPDGFTVSIEKQHNEYIVAYNGWHEHFTEPSETEDSFYWFLFGLTPACRIRQKSRGGVDYSWQLQFQHKGEWFRDGVVVVPRIRFWRRRVVSLLRNRYFTVEEILSDFPEARSRRPFSIVLT